MAKDVKQRPSYELTLLYNKPQYEIVYTIENESDSYTNWYSYLGFNNKIYTSY